MGTTYKATITINCWKQHECVGCGGAYRYKFERKVTGEAGNEAAAERAAEKSAMTTVEKDVDQRPCPRCGCLQPDMIAQSKSNTHFLLAAALLVLSAVLIIFGFVSSATLVTYALVGLVVCVMSALGVALHALVGLRNPNSNKEANRQRAAEAIDKGLVEEVADEDYDLAAGEPKAVGSGAVVLVVLGLLGAVLCAAPFVLKLVSGWPPVEGTKPEVLSPGDTVTMWFPDKIQAVKGYWNGNPVATVVSDGGIGIPRTLPATASTNTWGNTITGKSVSNSSPNLWAEIKMPADPNLAGKTIEVRVDMPIRYPSAQGGGFNDLSGNVSGTKKFTFAAAGASGLYKAAYWATVLGAVLVAISGFGLMVSANGLRKLAAPASVQPIKSRGRAHDEEEDEDDDDDDRPRKRRRDDDDDDDDRPRKARRVSREDEDDDDRPRKRRRDDDDDDDDDDRPRKRRRDDDDDDDDDRSYRPRSRR
ncbi:MAG: hypothetical protein MUF18_09330 [Fimbriiglobus sp.]|jgi:hypothetical protein|nr:hypothetical protein [Fimbriiglobus sp.]